MDDQTPEIAAGTPNHGPRKSDENLPPETESRPDWLAGTDRGGDAPVDHLSHLSALFHRFTEAADAAERLATILRAAIDDLHASEATQQSMSERTQRAEMENHRLRDIHEQLRQSLARDKRESDLNELADLLQAMAQKPGDLLVMVKVSEQADRLKQIVRMYEYASRLLDGG